MKTLIYGRVVLAALLTQACATEETVVRLTVVYDDAWELSELEVSAPEQSARVGAAHEVVVRFSDAQAGQETEIEIAGLRGDARYAVGRVLITPALGVEVAATVELSRIVCGAWCVEGATLCDVDGFVTCEEQPDGCMGWSAPTACPSDEPFCSLGFCGTECVDECVTGERRCAGPEAVDVCGQRDTDPCFEWMQESECAAGETCTFGSCVATCRDECEAGAVSCRDGGLSTCGDRNLDGCTERGPTVPCGDGLSCELGECRPTDECTNQCAGSFCGDTSLTECGNFDLDPCREFSPGISCVPADPCMEGRCELDRCVSEPRVCDDPPMPRCVDANTLEAFEPAGTCGEEGCEYESARTVCPDGCADGRCAGNECQPGIFDFMTFDNACFQ